MSFNTMFKVFEKGEPSSDDINKIPSYVFCRWLGNNPKTIHTANLINQYSKMPMLNQFYLVNNQFKGQRIFIKYPKNFKDESYEKEILCKHFKISMDKSKEYLEFISKEELDYILDLYKEKGK